MKKMLRPLVLLPFMFTVINVMAQKSKKPEDQITQFWLVMIKTGPKKDFDSTTKAGLFKGHMDNINRLYNEGIIKVAGPFGKNDFEWRGLFIFDCPTREDAERYAATDPAIAAGLFKVDIVPWYGAPTGSFEKGKPKKENE